MARGRESPTFLLLLCASCFLLLLLVTPGIAARALRPDADGKRLSEADFKAADDAVPSSSKEEYARKYGEWIRFLAEEVCSSSRTNHRENLDSRWTGCSLPYLNVAEDDKVAVKKNLHRRTR